MISHRIDRYIVFFIIILHEDQLEIAPSRASGFKGCSFMRTSGVRVYVPVCTCMCTSELTYPTNYDYWSNIVVRSLSVA